MRTQARVHTHRKEHMKTQGGDCSLQAKERRLRRKSTLQTSNLRTTRQLICPLSVVPCHGSLRKWIHQLSEVSFLWGAIPVHDGNQKGPACLEKLSGLRKGVSTWPKIADQTTCSSLPLRIHSWNVSYRWWTGAGLVSACMYVYV